MGRPYNLVDWRPTRAEREFFRLEGPKVTEEAPDFTLPSLDGGDVTLSSLKGMPTVLEFGSIT
jgi:cytochrome oxidase Cu insertion factor (SCO1/SenC/PrrC family)